jgi:hypothetical protein
MPWDCACLLVWQESTRQSLSFTLVAIDSERREIDRPACRVTPSFGRRSFLGKILKSRSALFAVAPARQGQISNAGADLSRPVAMVLIGMLLIWTVLLGSCSDISGRERAREVRLYGLCRCVRWGSAPTFLAGNGTQIRVLQSAVRGVQFGVREPEEHSGIKTAEPNC